MNTENDTQKKEELTAAPESDGFASIDDFIKELEAKERDLHLSYADTVVEIEGFGIEDDEIAELEKLLDSYQTSPPVKTAKLPAHVNHSSNAQSSAVLENEISKLRGELSKSSLEREEMNNSFRRRQTDFENFRKRTERDRNENYRNILSSLAIQILPVIDNLSRALDLASSRETDKSPDFEQFIEGILLVNHQLNEVLEEMGIHPILAVGEPFDPHFHEAVATGQTNEVPPNTVIAELLRGYKIEEKVIRPAMVRVSTAAAQKPALSDIE